MPFRWILPSKVSTLLIAAALWGVASPLLAQSSGRVTSEENFRREPNGVVLGRISSGTTLRLLETRDRWTQVAVEGWVWLPSLQGSDEAEYQLVVALEGGENLRAGPQGDVVGRLEEGTLLEEVSRQTSWARVRRTGWMWSASINAEAPAPAASSGPMIQPPAPGVTDLPAARRPGGFTSVGAGGGAVLTAPDGDTLAVVTPQRDVEILGREGNWARVRVDGWMWMPAPQPNADALEPTDEPLEPSTLAETPEAHAGRVVTWSLQFISLERAEAVRTDFFEGEPFLLTRFGGPDGAFVYVALPPDRLTEVDGLVPLERLSVTARVRTGASALTGTPIIDLLSLERVREAP